MSKGLKTAPFIGCNMEKDNLGNPVRVSGVARSWATATTSGSFIVATSVSGKVIRVMNLDVHSNVTTRVQFGSEATTITPLIAIAAGAPIQLGAEIFGQAPLQSETGDSIKLIIPAGEAGMGTGAIVTAIARSVSTTN